MDDFVISNLQESKNEWCERLVSILCPLVVEGVKSIFNEACKMCLDKDETAKYLMTFQNLLSRIPKWNSIIVEEERKRMIERSGCNYLEDLITCVHIIQLKVLTCIRVGNKQKKIDISIPKLDHFIHKLYTHVARKVYKNVYLFEMNISQFQMQKNERELELIIQECILTTIRESIPTEEIIRAYMDESVEHEEEVTIEQLTEPVLVNENGENEVVGGGENEGNEGENEGENTIKSVIKTQTHEDVAPPSLVPVIKDINNDNVTTHLSFNDYDSVLDGMNTVEMIDAPKTIERLEEISTSNALKRKLEEDDNDEDKIRIHTDNITLGTTDLFVMNDDNNDNDNDNISLLGVEELF
jgi:hypothetical protein